MRKLSKVMAGLMLSVALFTSSIVPAKAQSTLTYVSRTAFHITTAATTTVTSSDAYVASIVVSTSAVGTAFVAKVQNKEGTPKILIPALASSAVGYQTLIATQGAPIYMKGGIDIVSTGTPGVIDVFVTYYRP